jgi:nucleoside-diphosphate-sugar epimerase
MATLVVTGASGFLGSTFIHQHAHRFDLVKGLGRESRKIAGTNITSIACDLADYLPLLEVTRGVDCVIHTAYDRTDLQKNLIGLKNLINVCRQNRVKRLVYLSSFAVYDPFLEGTLSEEKSYSRHRDPYCRIKQQSEDLLAESFKINELEVIILQPTIVYGILGNWTAHAIKSVASGTLYLPEKGKASCNAVHADDVAEALYLSTQADLFNGPRKDVPRFLISGDRAITWEHFYRQHAALFQASFSIHSLESANRYADGLAANTLYRLLFSASAFQILRMAGPILKKFMSQPAHGYSIRKIMEEGAKAGPFVPKGMNRIYHAAKFTVDISYAKASLGFAPRKSVDSFPEELKKLGL